MVLESSKWARYSFCCDLKYRGVSGVFLGCSPFGTPQMLALKTVKVDVRGEHAEVLLSGYANEIELLRSLQGSPYIIHLENAEVSLRSAWDRGETVAFFFSGTVITYPRSRGQG